MKLVGALLRSLRLPQRFGILAGMTLPALLAGTSWGATATWDPAFSLAGSDGSGAWTGSANWSNGTSDAFWTDGDTAIFGSGGTAGTVTLPGTVAVAGIVFNPVAGSYTISGGTIGFGATSSITANASATISSALSGSATTLSKLGTGTLTIGGPSTGISAINVNAGVLKTATTGAGSFGNSATNIVVSSGAAVQVASGSVIQNNITFNGGSAPAAYVGGATLSGGVTLASGDTKINAGNTAKITGVISGSGSLTLSGPNKLTLSGLNTYSGGTTITDGVLEVAGGGSLGTGAVVNGTNLTLNTTAGNLTITNAISGSGSITKSGPGTATLSGAITSTGYTIVSGGTLLVNGTKTGTTGASGSLVYVSSGAKLGGTGTIIGATAGAITLLSGGAISPGLANAIGILTATSLAWTTDSATAGMIFNLGNGGLSDLLVLTGAFTRSSGTSYVFDFQNSGANGVYTLVNYGSTASTSVANLVATNLPSGRTGTFNLSGTGAGSLTLTVVPEPGEIGLAIAALAGLAIIARRRSRAAALIAAAGLALPSAGAKTVTIDLETATFDDLQAAMNAGALTSVEMATLYLSRRAVYDQAGININSVVSINPNVLDDAAAQDELRAGGTLLGPLQGLVFCTKDSYPTVGMVTTGGVKAWLSSVTGTFGTEAGVVYGPVVSPGDCFVVQKLKAAGAVQLGHGNMDTWATSASSTTSNAYGTTLNAYCLGSASGSSGGPGALTGSNFANFAWGGETGGSIRNPSDRAGVTGFKVSVGTNSVNNIIPLASDRDVVGPMARYVKDEAYIMDAASTVLDPQDLWASINYVPGRGLSSGYATKLASASLAGKRIGVVGTYLGTARPSPAPTPVQLTGADVEKALGSGNGHGGISNFGTATSTNTTSATTNDVPVKAAHDRLVTELQALGATVVTVYLPPNCDTGVTIPTTFADGSATPTAALGNTNPAAGTTYANTTLALENRGFQLYHGQGIYTRLTQANAASSSLTTTVRNLAYNNQVSDFTAPAAVTHFQLKAIYNRIYEKFMDTNSLDCLIWPVSYNKTRSSNSVNGRDLVNNMGLPVCTVPIGVYPLLGGEPIDEAFLGRYRQEAEVLAIAGAYQAAYNHRIPSPLSPALDGETITYTTPEASLRPDRVSAKSDKLAPVVSIKTMAAVEDGKVVINGIAVDGSGVKSIRVTVNGRKVAAKAGKRWTAKVSLAELRKWTKSKAKSIDVIVLAKDAFGNASAAEKIVKF